MCLLGICLLFSACGKGENGDTAAQQAQQDWASLQSAQFEVKIISDLGKSTLEYTLDYAYNKEDNDTFLITAPEALAGISASVAGDAAPAFTLQYEGTALDAPGPSRPGLTPADAIPYLLYDLRASSPAEIWTETKDKQSLTVLKYIHADEANGQTATRQVWLHGKAPAYAEIYADGALVLRLEFINFTAA